MSGVIRALGLLRHSASGLDEDSARQVDAGIGLLEELLESLPEAHDLAACLCQEYTRIRNAEGMSPRAHKLKRAYMNIERVLDACQAFSVSTDIESVDEATRILQRVMDRIDHSQLYVTRGDVLRPTNHGAVIRASYRNSSALELSLRRAHPFEDCMPGEGDSERACPEGHWLLEGGAWNRDLSADGVGTSELGPDLYEPLGPDLPENIEQIIEDQVRAYMRACPGDVRRLASAGSHY